MAKKTKSNSCIEKRGVLKVLFQRFSFRQSTDKRTINLRQQDMFSSKTSDLSTNLKAQRKKKQVADCSREPKY